MEYYLKLQKIKKKTGYKNFVIQHYVDLTEHALAGG